MRAKYNLNDVTLICPSNDLESETILRIARTTEMIDVRPVSLGWGGRLSDLEPGFFENLRTHVWIVELPDINKENELHEKGHDVGIIDHHT